MSYAALSPFFESSLPPKRRSVSPITFQSQFPIPRSPEQCDGLLEQARRRMRLPDVRRHFASELARFLGAGSSVWTASRREALQDLLASAGEEAIEPVLASVERNPSANVADDAEVVLAAIVRRSNSLVSALLARFDRPSTSAVRAVLIRSLSHMGKQVPQSCFETALKDDDAEVRDAAAIAIGQLGLRALKRALERRLQREKNPVVIDSIQTAVEQLETA